MAWLLVLATINESLQSHVWEVAEVMPSDKARTSPATFCSRSGFADSSGAAATSSSRPACWRSAAAMEIAQGLMHQGRTADWFDMLANTLGIGSALILATLGLGNWMVWIERLLRLQK